MRIGGHVLEKRLSPIEAALMPGDLETLYATASRPSKKNKNRLTGMATATVLGLTASMSMLGRLLSKYNNRSCLSCTKMMQYTEFRSSERGEALLRKRSRFKAAQQLFQD